MEYDAYFTSSQKDYTHFMYFIAVNMCFVTFEGGTRHIHKIRSLTKTGRGNGSPIPRTWEVPGMDYRNEALEDCS